jgi:hypothetical protein
MSAAYWVLLIPVVLSVWFLLPALWWRLKRGRWPWDYDW